MGYRSFSHILCIPRTECAVDRNEYARTRLLGLTFRCEPNGDYSPVQCTGSVCYCVDLRGTRGGPASVPISQQNTLKCGTPPPPPPIG